MMVVLGHQSKKALGLSFLKVIYGSPLKTSSTAWNALNRGEYGESEF